MKVLITQIKENLYVFTTKDFHSSELETEFMIDCFTNKIKSWIKDKLNQESATYVISHNDEEASILAIVGEKCSISTENHGDGSADPFYQSYSEA
jgi:hypothetical protein